ncbi:hypothetical protein G6O69_31380 [Pseudenhygromyxa sp. WMMC2535]|uniref:hypothetical protein n=1 Tax=Pseudenhygromyxa sp. WMMC2535 TaxID=2712867 RepID=UPI0015961103|nr:hypothetical protein [Pseudenhygromyxa sp. WMMC2535]NVB42367.1 hypothetical protein [Pseudenhygromyxa sp. WMMC2535]
MEWTPLVIRDGPLRIIGHGPDLASSIDGWPRPLSLAGLEARGPTPRLDSIARDERVATGYAVGPNGDVFVVVQAISPRSGWYDAAVQRRDDEDWRAVTVDTDPLLVDYYSVLFVRSGAVFGLLAHGPDANAIDLSSPAGAKQAERAMAQATTRFVRIAGSSTATTPSIPDNRALTDVRASANGTVHALATPPLGGERAQTLPEVLRWAPDANLPQRSRLPGLSSGEHLHLSTCGDEVIVFGDGRYLAREQREGWVKIPVELPNDEHLADAGDRIHSATCTPDGELWLALDHSTWGPRILLRRPPASKRWMVARVPALSEESISARPFIYEDGWVEAEFEGHYEFPRYDALAWADGRLWVLASFGPLEHPFRGVYSNIRRNVIYTVGEIEREPEIATPRYADWAVDSTGAQQVGGSCDPFWMVLDRTGRADVVDEAKRDALAELSSDPEVVELQLLYVGELDGRRELVLQAHAEDPRAAEELVRRVSEILGLELFADCRVRTPVEAIAEFRRL